MDIVVNFTTVTENVCLSNTVSHRVQVDIVFFDLFDRFLQGCSSQQLGINGNDNGADGHEHGAHCRGEQDAPVCQHTCREWNGNNIVACCPLEILNHLVVTGAAEFEDFDHIERIAVDQDQASGFDGNIRAAADGDTHIRAGEGGRVVHSVADHCHAFPKLL